MTARRAEEPFGRLPNRLARDTAASDLTFNGLGILAYIELTTDYRADPPVWIGTTEDLMRGMGWPHSRRTLLDELNRLRDAQYIVGGPNARSKRPYRIWLLRADCAASARRLRGEDAFPPRSEWEARADGKYAEARPNNGSGEAATASAAQPSDSDSERDSDVIRHDTEFPSDSSHSREWMEWE